MIDEQWPAHWTGRWIWNAAPEEVARFPFKATPAHSHFVYLRRAFVLADAPTVAPVRVTCDSRYVLFLNGDQIGRGPVRSEPEHLGWDDYDLAPHLHPGSNVVVALCRYYGTPGPWWVPAAPFGTLGRGSFCLDAGPGAPPELHTGPRWRAVPAPWLAAGVGTAHGLPPEVIDGRRCPVGLHDADADAEERRWTPAVVVSGEGHGTVLDRPPAAPYTSPQRRPIPRLTSVAVQPRRVDTGDLRAHVDDVDDPAVAWHSLRQTTDGDRVLTVWACPRLTLGHVRLAVRPPSGDPGGAVVDIVGGEELRADGLPEIKPRQWAGRYITAATGADAVQRVAFFDPVGLQYLAVHHPPGFDVTVVVEESGYPRAEGAAFDCDDARYTDRWLTGARTVDVCSTDAFLDCPGREQRAWVADAYPQMLVSLATNPDWRLVRHHLALTAASRQAGGLLAGAAACDFAHSGLTMPDYSLHWLRSLAAYWRYSGDEALVASLLPVADGIIERYERQRGAEGLLDDFPGWVFLDWAQTARGRVMGAHDGLHAAALEDYAGLPGASDVTALIAQTRAGFEALWDADRGVYVDALDDAGPVRRVSQHTNAAALLGGLVPAERVAGVIDTITDPAAHLGGRLVVTTSSADVREGSRIPVFQYESPADFDDEVDVVAAQPWFCRFLHEALFRHCRRDLILASLLRWPLDPEHGTFPEFWGAAPGTSSRCHGWSASPTYDLTAHVLGVRPGAPGFTRAVVDPYLGPLQWATGRVPTPHGWLSVSVTDEGVEVDAPDGVTVDVATG